MDARKSKITDEATERYKDTDHTKAPKRYQETYKKEKEKKPSHSTLASGSNDFQIEIAQTKSS